MTEDRRDRPDLMRAVVRVCPACGVVNPAGPSGQCPHIQIVRLDGVPADLALSMEDLAEARHAYHERLAEVRAAVMRAIQEGKAEVETPFAERRNATQERRPPPALRLEPTEPPRTTARRRSARQRPVEGVDPRQLELLVKSPPKGEA